MKRAEEKMKSDRYAPVLIMKYTDADQSKNTDISEVKETILTVVCGEKRDKRKQEKARPPSNPRAGRRLIKANKKEDAAKSRQSNLGKNADVNIALKRFANGPERHRMASLT